MLETMPFNANIIRSVDGDLCDLLHSTSPVSGHKKAQIAIDSYPITGGDYLATISTRREMFASYPGSHPDCARAFSGIAFSLERRAWRADKVTDIEAATAFRHEAWMIAVWRATSMFSVFS
ncbi:hypothetical protein L218DRAFT_983986 [Marasmius fiardii PR-910]|nr:hypothetical protein L218DRAFT_983986 [Marasmius fiardii PR-910]